jgi:hypothetical protein
LLLEGIVSPGILLGQRTSLALNGLITRNNLPLGTSKVDSLMNFNSIMAHSQDKRDPLSNFRFASSYHDQSLARAQPELTPPNLPFLDSLNYYKEKDILS